MSALNHKQLGEDVQQYIDQMRHESRLEGAFVHACMAVINNRRLASCDSNRAMLESLLNPGEEPSSKLYVMLAEQFPDRFTWETAKTQPTREGQLAAFNRFVREHNLSGCDANFRLFEQNADLAKFAPAAQGEATAYANEAALQRKKWLRTEASPLELRIEAQHEAQASLVANKQAQADAALQAQKERDQYGGYKPLPSHINKNALLKASKDELRRLSKLYGQFQLNTALRGQQ